jgi:anti-anti-sigma factor
MDVTESGSSDRPEPSGRPLEIRVRASARGTVISPRGELDIATASELEAVMAAQSGPLVLDMRELTFIDLAGARLILEANARSRADGALLRFVPGETVQRLFELLELDEQLLSPEPPAA